MTVSTSDRAPDRASDRPLAGVTGVTRLATPRRASPGPDPAYSAMQGTLALELDPPAGLADVPELRVVTGGPGPVRLWAARFAQSLIEVLVGDRGAHQLLRCTTEAVYARIVERVGVLDSVARPHQRARRLRAQVRSIHLFQPEPSVAEVCVHVRHGERSRALAIRLEVVAGRWQCVAVEFG